MIGNPEHEIEKIERRVLVLYAVSAVLAIACVGAVVFMSKVLGFPSKEVPSFWLVFTAPFWISLLVISFLAVNMWARHKKSLVMAEYESDAEILVRYIQRLKDQSRAGGATAFWERLLAFGNLVNFTLSDASYLPYFDVLRSRVIIPHEWIVWEWFGAAQRGDVNVMKHLFDSGLIAKGENPRGASGQTVAQVAALHGKVDVIAFLMEVGLCTSLKDILPVPEDQKTAPSQETAAPDEPSIPVVVIESSASEPSAVQVPASEPSIDTGNSPSTTESPTDTGDQGGGQVVNKQV